MMHHEGTKDTKGTQGTHGTKLPNADRADAADWRGRFFREGDKHGNNGTM